MQMASSASWAARLSRSASLYATTASTPSVLHARRIRRAISPRLAMRIFRNISEPPSAHVRGRRELEADQLLAVLDRRAPLDERRRDDPVRGSGHVLRHAE